MTEPCVIGGDFNWVCSEEDKSENLTDSDKALRKWANIFIKTNNLNDTFRWKNPNVRKYTHTYMIKRKEAG
jgi:exonuclease III